uniref:Exonuclease domain-containing protein n=1 Tax=viral metagenome TaxID=1070528 RepID=A0A6C0EDU7_9ZZZZ
MTTIIVTPPVRKSRFLVFDVETNNLMPKQKPNGTRLTIDDYPHILQLSFVIYDMNESKITKSYDAYVNINENVVISDSITELTGITKDICKKKGVPIVTILKEFYEAYMNCDVLIAHNMEFDVEMIKIEIERNRTQILSVFPYVLTTFSDTYEKINNIERYCTMRKGIPICNILVESKIPGRPPTKKFPRLIELYQHLFTGETATGLHNSMIDVLVCLRCYLKMRHNIIIEANDFERIVKTIKK